MITQRRCNTKQVQSVKAWIELTIYLTHSATTWQSSESWDLTFSCNLVVDLRPKISGRKLIFRNPHSPHHNLEHAHCDSTTRHVRLSDSIALSTSRRLINLLIFNNYDKSAYIFPIFTPAFFFQCAHCIILFCIVLTFLLCFQSVLFLSSRWYSLSWLQKSSKVRRRATKSKQKPSQSDFEKIK